MWWFTSAEERTMTRHLNKRRSLAQRISRDARLARLAKENLHLATEALRLAQADEPLFDRLFGEPMPQQLRIALHLEADVWTDVKNKLSNDDWRGVLPRRLETIQKLLALQREMIHTPLVRRYEQAIDRIKREQRQTAGQ